MIYGSVCSGIEAATVAWHPLGWRAAFYAEIDAFPCALLSHYYPAPNYGDMTKFAEWPDADIDVLVGGTPCQAFSTAGLRKGFADPRGNLTLTYLALAGRYRPNWILWENVPGVLSQDGGRAFGSFLGGLAELGYGWAYRVMDAQYFKLAQRRPRVFVVASARGWASAAAVLFERASLQGHPAPSRAEGKGFAHELAPGIGASGRGYSRAGETRGQDPVIATLTTTSHDWSRNEPGAGMIAHALSAEGCDASEDGTGRGTPIIATDGHTMAVALRGREGGATAELSNIPSALRASNGGGDKAHVLTRSAVRRLTPRECERLQGFPDDYTLIPYKSKPAKDTPRYKALGNSMAVPVMRWLGERIAFVEGLAQERAA